MLQFAGTNLCKYVACYGLLVLLCVNTGCLTLNDNKIKHYISLTIQSIGEVDTFSNFEPHKVPYVLSVSQYGTISGKTRVKTIFSFSPGIDKHFINNAFSISDDSLAKLIHILRFLMMDTVRYKPPD